VDAALVVPASFRLVFRGAGKSTIGSLIIIFDLYGPSGYPRMEREALESILKQILRGTIIYK
jgi:hypothetical protein